MLIRLAHIAESGLTIEETRPASWLQSIFPIGKEDMYRPAGDVRFDLKLWMDGKNVRVKGRVETVLTSICGRCLLESEVAVGVRIDETFVPAAMLLDRKETVADKDDDDATDDEALCATYDNDEIELGRYCAEMIMLSAPLFPVCAEGVGCYGKKVDHTEDWGEPSSDVEDRKNEKWLAGLKQAKKHLM